MFRPSTMQCLALAALLPLGLLLAGPASALTYYVGGNETGCTHHDLQTAINELPHAEGNVIHVANSLSYTEVALTIDGKGADIIGGYAHCADATPSTVTVLDGASNGAHSVVKLIGDTVVTLENFTIQNGHQGSDSHGGGINFTGHGYMTLRNDLVQHNSCGYGAGLHVSPDGASAITIAAGTQFINNTADHSGGGIRIEGNTLLQMTEPQTQLFFNGAIDGYGGGIEIIGPARADVGSPDLGSNGVIYLNSAKYGGGISVTSSAQGTGLLRLYSTDAAHPTRLQNNSAGETGGAIYLKGYNGGSSGIFQEARVCAYDFRMDGNVAKDGTAIYSDDDDGLGSSIYLNRLDDPGNACLIASTPPSGAVRCTPGLACNAITDGTAEDESHQATEGSAITIGAAGKFLADNLQLLRNSGGYVMHSDANRGVAARTRGCVIADNTVSGALVASADDSPLAFEYCTIARNTIGGPYVFSLSDDLDLERSIIAQPDSLSLHESDNSASLVTQMLLVSDTSTLPPNLSITASTDPRFIDPAHGDYHLQAASPAVDFADSADVALDLDGLARNQNLPLVIDRVPIGFGTPGDLGAFERQSIGNLALNDAFNQDLRLWTDVVAGTSFFDTSTNAIGLSGSGSVRLDVPRSSAPVSGLTQCIHVPGAATYALNAYALAPGNQTIGHDIPALHWKLRYNSATCSGGTLAGESDLSIPAGSPTWHQAVAPALITVPNANWGPNTTIEVTLKVTEGSQVAGGDTLAWFDGVSLVPHDSDVIFANGFD